MYRIGQEEIDAVARVLETRALCKINSKGAALCFMHPVLIHKISKEKNQCYFCNLGGLKENKGTVGSVIIHPCKNKNQKYCGNRHCKCGKIPEN